MKEIKTIFFECPICKHLTESEDVVTQQIQAENVYGADVMVNLQQTHEPVFCEKCTVTLWPKEYAPIAPKILNEKPKPKTKKVTKKTKKPLTKKKKSTIIDASKDKNEDIEKN